MDVPIHQPTCDNAANSKQMAEIDITLPIITVSETNSHEHWSHKIKRHKKQQQLVRLALNGKELPQLPCTVTLIRHSFGVMDDDGLPAAFKWLRDAIADKILPGMAPGRADGDPRIKWRYDQHKVRPSGIRVIIAPDFPACE